MPDVTIERVEGEEIVRYAGPLERYAFYATPPANNEERLRARIPYFETSHVYVLFEGDEAMASVTGVPMLQNVRGNIYKMAGISAVATHPLGRRKGYARQTLLHVLSHMRGLGYGLTTLYPFRESFYERLGYAIFPQITDVLLDPAALYPLLKLELGGKLEFSHIRDGYDGYRQYMLERQQHMHGMALFEQPRDKWQRDLNDDWLVLARDDDDQIIGSMIYTIKGYRDRMLAHSFYYSNSQGKYLLLSWLGRHIDQVKRVDLLAHGQERPATWFADLGVTPKYENWLTPMGRVLDVDKLNGLNVNPGEFTARIQDEQFAWNNGTFTFSESDGHLQVTPSDATPDCDLTMQGLSALIYGTHPLDDYKIRGWGTLTPDLASRMQRMFPMLHPHLHEQF